MHPGEIVELGQCGSLSPTSWLKRHHSIECDRMRKHSYFGGNSKDFDEHHCGRLYAAIKVRVYAANKVQKEFWVYAANKVQKEINE